MNQRSPIKDLKDDETQRRPSKLPGALLFFANWLFVVSASKKVVRAPEGDFDFLVKNVGTFMVALVVTGLMIHFSSKKVVILLIPIMAVLALTMSLR
jgi:hypothetical protein